MCRLSSGAVFIDRNVNGQTIALQRDRDIPALVGRVGGFGLMGSDAWLPQKRRLRERLVRVPLVRLDGVRFALSVLKEQADQVEEKLATGKPLKVAAVYRELAREALGPDTQVIRLTEGGLEALPQLLTDIDGTFDLVESGQTASDNRLVCLRDNLVPVTLDAVWLAGR